LATVSVGSRKSSLVFAAMALPYNRPRPPSP